MVIFHGSLCVGHGRGFGWVELQKGELSALGESGELSESLDQLDQLAQLAFLHIFYTFNNVFTARYGSETKISPKSLQSPQITPHTPTP